MTWMTPFFTAIVGFGYLGTADRHTICGVYLKDCPLHGLCLTKLDNIDSHYWLVNNMVRRTCFNWPGAP